MQPQARFAINVIENDAHEVLFLRRVAGSRLGPGLWGFCAGHIEAGEQARAASMREFAEELGNDAKAELIKTFGPVRDTWYGGIYELHLFHYHWLGGTIQLNEEHDALAWVGKQDYRELAVMDGIDEDLYYLDIWPREYLNADKLDLEPGPL